MKAGQKEFFGFGEVDDEEKIMEELDYAEEDALELPNVPETYLEPEE